MAFITPSGLISDIKGKLNGSYFQSKKNGITINNINSRNKGKSSSNNAVQLQKGRVTFISRMWSQLTGSQQAGWNAAAGTMTRVNKNGVTYVPNGYQLFCEYSLNLATMGFDPVNTYSGESIPVDMSYVNVVPDVTNLFNLRDETDLGANLTILVYATAPQSKGVRYPKSAYRLIYQATSDDSTVSISGEYIQAFGALSAGDTVFFKIRAMVTASGRAEGSKLTKADAG